MNHHHKLCGSTHTRPHPWSPPIHAQVGTQAAWPPPPLHLLAVCGPFTSTQVVVAIQPSLVSAVVVRPSHHRTYMGFSTPVPFSHGRLSTRRRERFLTSPPPPHTRRSLAHLPPNHRTTCRVIVYHSRHAHHSLYLAATPHTQSITTTSTQIPLHDASQRHSTSCAFQAQPCLPHRINRRRRLFILRRGVGRGVVRHGGERHPVP